MITVGMFCYLCKLYILNIRVSLERNSGLKTGMLFKNSDDVKSRSA